MPVEQLNHAMSHASGGVDPVTPAAIVAVPDTGKTLQLTWTGAWQTAYPFEMCSQWVVPSGAAVGQQDLAVTNGVGIYQFVYSENSISGPYLTSLTFDNLGFVGGTFGPTYMQSLGALNLPALVFIGGSFYPVSLPALTTCNLPSLASVGINFQTSTLSTCTALCAPSLVSVGGSFNPYNLGSLTALSLPSLAHVGGQINLSSMGVLASFAAPALKYCGNTMGTAVASNSSMGNLTSFVLGSVGVATLIPGGVNVSSQKLVVASIDRILAVLASLDGTKGTTAYNAYSVALSAGTNAAPSFNGTKQQSTSIAARTPDATHCRVTKNGHGWVTGDIVTLTGATPAGFDGTYVVGDYTENTLDLLNSTAGPITVQPQMRKCLTQASTSIQGQTPDATHATITKAGHGYRAERVMTSSSMVGAAGTVTVACPGHGFATGDLIFVTGSNSGDATKGDVFNGVYAITKTGDDTFTYANSGCNGLTATVQATLTREAEVIAITNATPAGFNGVYKILYVDADTFQIVNSTAGDASVQGNLTKDGYAFYQLLVSTTARGFAINRSNTVTITALP